jgi:hypothetical protein
MFDPSSFWPGLPEITSLPKIGPDGESDNVLHCPIAPSQPSRRTIGSYVQRQTEARNEVTPSVLSRHPP